MDENNSIGIALEKLSLQDNDVVVIKVDRKKWGMKEFAQLYHAIQDISPNPVIAIPDGIHLGTKSIDYMIQYLEDMKKN